MLPGINLGGYVSRLRCEHWLHRLKHRGEIRVGGRVERSHPLDRRFRNRAVGEGRALTKHCMGWLWVCRCRAFNLIVDRVWLWLRVMHYRRVKRNTLDARRQFSSGVPYCCSTANVGRGGRLSRVPLQNSDRDKQQTKRLQRTARSEVKRQRRDARLSRRRGKFSWRRRSRLHCDEKYCCTDAEQRRSRRARRRKWRLRFAHQRAVSQDPIQRIFLR